ncbi:MAG: hypothetical protein QM516_01235 [Limnohabitans sp.]|nr:hypothetical protein [Limnohabitans sp.]
MRQEIRVSPEPVFGEARSAWTIGTEESATVGDLILANGLDVRTGPAFELTRELKFSLPGSYGVGFDCTLQPCVLEPHRIVGDDVLYVAPKGAGSATFNGKSVFAELDELGLRVNERTGVVSLYCDNGRFNGVVAGFAVWKRAISPEERAAFRKTTCERMFWRPQSAALRYSGSSGGEVRFIYTRYAYVNADGVLVELDSTEFRFDAPSTGRGEIAVRGALIELLATTPTELRYIIRTGFSAPNDRAAPPSTPELKSQRSPEA